MKKILAIVLMLALASQLYGCGAAAPKGTFMEIGDVPLGREYQSVTYEGEKNLSPDNHSFATVYFGDQVGNNTELQYNLTSYDSNGVQQHEYKDINIYSEQDVGNVSCKVVPNGHFTLEVRNANLTDSTKVDLVILTE